MYCIPRWQTSCMVSTYCCTAQLCLQLHGAMSLSVLSLLFSPPSPSCSGVRFTTFQSVMTITYWQWSPPPGTSQQCQLFLHCCSAWRSSAPSTTTPCHGCAGLRPGGFTLFSGKRLYLHNLEFEGEEDKTWKKTKSRPSQRGIWEEKAVRIPTDERIYTRIIWTGKRREKKEVKRRRKKRPDGFLEHFWSLPYILISDSTYPPIYQDHLLSLLLL